jgi:DNA-binding MarR family transcriptional regulator
VARLLTSVYDRELRDAGIDAPQFALLATIAQEGPCTQAVIGRLHAFDKSTTSRNLAVLDKSGWVTFSTTGDGRERNVTLTPAGKRQLTRARAAWQHAQDEMKRGMTAAQWAAMFETFRTLTHVAGAAQVKGTAKARPASNRG